jgi:hypothetical protein
MRLRSIAIAMVVIAFSATATAKPHRSMRTAADRRSMAMLDELEREQAHQREKIALLQADSERRDRTDRIVLVGAVGLAGVLVVVYARKKKKS